MGPRLRYDEAELAHHRYSAIAPLTLGGSRGGCLAASKEKAAGRRFVHTSMAKHPRPANWVESRRTELPPALFALDDALPSAYRSFIFSTKLL
jgi:hypothetical protein